MDKFIQDQKLLCKNLSVFWKEVDKELKVGLADNILDQIDPINGLRHPAEKDTTGWYFWAGQEFSTKKDWFKPYCVKDLVHIKPELIKYLALPPGYRILIDSKVYYTQKFVQ